MLPFPHDGSLLMKPTSSGGAEMYTERATPGPPASPPAPAHVRRVRDVAAPQRGLLAAGQLRRRGGDRLAARPRGHGADAQAVPAAALGDGHGARGCPRSVRGVAGRLLPLRRTPAPAVSRAGAGTTAALRKLCTSRAKSGVGASHASHASALGRHIYAEAWAISKLLCLPCALACQRASPHPRLRVPYSELP